jgi:hypothetical protein
MTPEQPLNSLAFSQLCPGSSAMDRILARYR